MSHYVDFVHDTGGDNSTGIWQVWHVNFGRPKLVPQVSANSGTELITKYTGQQYAHFKLHNSVTLHMCKMETIKIHKKNNPD